ncbi:MAG: hemolysin family protein [Planctomycetota bacterium]
MPHPDLLILFFAGLLVSAFFSGSEAAVLACSRVRIRMLADQGNSSARLLDRLLERPNRLIAAILIGNNVANVATASIAAVIATSLLKDSGLSNESVIAINTVVVASFLLLVGEITPKGVAITFSEPVALLAARPLWLLQILLAPLITALTLVNVGIERMFRVDPADRDRVSPDELKHLAQMMSRTGDLHEHTSQMVTNVLQLSSVMARDVMVPRTEVAVIPSNASPAVVLEIVRTKRRSRYPVYDADKGIDELIGVVNVIDLIELLAAPAIEGITPPPFDIGELGRKRPPYFVTEFMKVGQLFHELQSGRHQLAIVVDEYGGTAGLVTMEDIVEEIVGEILDEFEPLPIRRVNSSTFVVQGTVRLDEMADAIGVHLEDEEAEDVDTVGGYVFARLGRVPSPGERIDAPGVMMIVRRLDGRRIRSLVVSLMRPLVSLPETPGGGTGGQGGGNGTGAGGSITSSPLETQTTDLTADVARAVRLAAEESGLNPAVRLDDDNPATSDSRISSGD